MIVAVVDDLMMRSRITTAAKHAGAEVRFAATADDVLALAGGGARMLVFDLNNRRTRPGPVIERLKATAGLGAVRIVGFVSHVDRAAIADAKQAGVAEVLARSAFVHQLPALLAWGSQDPGESGSTE